MDETTPLPASIGAPRAEDDVEGLGVDASLVRLYKALKELDGAIHNALRALDVSLGRNPSSGPPKTLPYRELGRLKNQLEAATNPAGPDGRRRLVDIAREDVDEPAGDGD